MVRTPLPCSSRQWCPTVSLLAELECAYHGGRISVTLIKAVLPTVSLLAACLHPAGQQLPGLWLHMVNRLNCSSATQLSTAYGSVVEKGVGEAERTCRVLCYLNL